MPDTIAQTYLVADLFCGAGGSSTGAARAITDIGGRMNLVAVNHWETAIATHSRNHPQARHIIADVSTADPEALVPEGRLDLLLASPECRYYSRARGGKPVKDQGRMNPWAIHDWLTKLNIRCVIIENVPEFVNWGPLDENGRPDRNRRGQYFQAWYLAFGAIGYQAEWRMLTAADYGDATTRTRFFLVARRDGLPICWPEPTHVRTQDDRPDTMLPGRTPWRSAREIIDWSVPGYSILDHPKYRSKPLSVNTRRRIAHGLKMYGGALANRYIPLLDLPDVPTADGISDAQPQPFLVNRHGENGTARCHRIDQPVPTITTRGGGYLCHPAVSAMPTPFVVQYNGTGTAHTVDRPLSTITTIPKHGLTCPAIIRANHGELRPKPPAPESAVSDRRRLIMINEVPHQLDIRFRMLSNAELARAMGFTDDEHDYEFTGNTSEVTRQIGNAVPVHTAYALVKATLGQGIAHQSEETDPTHHSPRR